MAYRRTTRRAPAKGDDVPPTGDATAHNDGHPSRIAPIFSPVPAPRLGCLRRAEVMTFLEDYDRYKAAVLDSGGVPQPPGLLVNSHVLRLARAAAVEEDGVDDMFSTWWDPVQKADNETDKDFEAPDDDDSPSSTMHELDKAKMGEFEEEDVEP